MVNEEENKTKSDTISLRLKPEVHERLKSMAAAEGITKSELVHKAIEQLTAYSSGDNGNQTHSRVGSKAGSKAGSRAGSKVGRKS